MIANFKTKPKNYDENINNQLHTPKVYNEVTSPRHYTEFKNECIDVMIDTQGPEAVKNFCLCNAFKYLYRHNKKNGEEDIKKASWYLNKYISLLEEKGE